METRTKKTEKGEEMSKMKDLVQFFLEEYGYDLGYTIHTLPKIEDIQAVAMTRTPVWTYFGKTEKEYYGGR